MAEAEAEHASALRRLVGQLQELCDLYGSPPFFSQDHFNRIDPSWCPFDSKPESKSTPKFSEFNFQSESQNSPPHKRPKANSSPNPQIQETEIQDSKSRILNHLLESRKTESGILKHLLESQQMESHIWKHLIEDLFSPILSRLPIPSIFRFQSVCSQWRGITKSKAFNADFLNVPKLHPWFYTVTHEDSTNGSMYDPCNKKWHHPAIPFFSDNNNNSNNNDNNYNNNSDNNNKMVLPVASCGGLICFLDFSQMVFYVCNPLTKNYKKLAPRTISYWSRVSVAMINLKNGYKIILLNWDGEYEIYDSVVNKWVRTGMVPANIKLPLNLNFRPQVVSTGTTLYFIQNQPNGILTYDLTTNTWKQYIIPLPVYMRDCTIAELQGRILLIGLITKNCANCIVVWELQRMSMLYKEVDRMPSELCLELYGKRIKMNCMGSDKGLVFLSLRGERVNLLVCYDCEEREWVKVPECVNGLTGRNKWILCGTAFDPCPNALP